MHGSFLHNLLNHGPEYLQKYKARLDDPEVVDAIPLKKTSQVPNTALDVAPSTPAQNAEALDAFFRQAGIGDPTENSHIQSANNTTILVFGDLLTGECIRSLMESRSEERTPWRRLQFVVYVMGLFHLKMACADVCQQPKQPCWSDSPKRDWKIQYKLWVPTHA